MNIRQPSLPIKPPRRHPRARGFAAVGLWQPKSDGNVGGAIRAACAFDARLVALIGNRRNWETVKGRLERTDPQQSHRHMPVVMPENVKDAIPHECRPVAIEIHKGGQPLPEYEHPQSAFYLFGPEDGSLPADALELCHDIVEIPTRRCLNLAMAVNVVLYDRAAKQMRG